MMLSVHTTCQVRTNSHSDDTNNGPIAYLGLNLGFSATVLKRHRTQRLGIRSMSHGQAARSRDSLLLLVLALGSLNCVSAAVNFTQCLVDAQNLYGNATIEGLVDNNGGSVPALHATALSYNYCKSECGSLPEAFDWTQFSQQFSSWLLPWLALLSQLPFGANDPFSNLMALVLTVGSPVLASFSLFMTVLNRKWISDTLTRQPAPALQNRAALAARILNHFQQVPIFVVPPDEGDALRYLVSAKDNENWWLDLYNQLQYPHTWSNIAISTMIWVFLAYLFTVVDSFTGDIVASLQVNGQGIGTLWLWLLAVVLAWLKVSPRVPNKPNEIAEILHQIKERHPQIHNSRGDNIPLANRYWPISVEEFEDSELELYADQACTSPLYNYARMFSWTVACQRINIVLKRRARSNGRPATDSIRTPSLSDSGLFRRMIIAMGFALLLQWGTAGSAMIVVWFTPTTGTSSLTFSIMINKEEYFLL
jgi:hypothetical protein